MDKIMLMEEEFGLNLKIATKDDSMDFFNDYLEEVIIEIVENYRLFVKTVEREILNRTEAAYGLDVAAVARAKQMVWAVVNTKIRLEKLKEKHEGDPIVILLWGIISAFEKEGDAFDDEDLKAILREVDEVVNERARAYFDTDSVSHIRELYFMVTTNMLLTGTCGALKTQLFRDRKVDKSFIALYNKIRILIIRYCLSPIVFCEEYEYRKRVDVDDKHKDLYDIFYEINKEFEMFGFDDEWEDELE